MQTTDGEWILNKEELSAVAAHAGVSAGPLGVLPDAAAPGEKAEAAVREFEALEPSLVELYRRAVAVLASPDKVVRFNTTAGDTRVSRSILAWGDAMEGAWISMASAGDVVHVCLRSEGELRLLVARHLAADTAVTPDRVGADLSTHAALAFLACCAQARRARLISLLRQEEPVGFFGVEDVAARFEEASTPDFRWPLSFVADLIPIPLAEMAVTKDPAPALVELVKAGFLEVAGEGKTPIFDFTEGGRLFSDGLCEEAGRAALAVTRQAQGGVIAHDVMLVSRTSSDLLCFFMSGETAFVSTLLAGDLDELLKTALAPPEKIAPEQVPQPAEEEEERTVIFEEGLPLRLAWLELDGKKMPLEPDGVLGRKEDCQVVLDNPGISRRHARLTAGPGGWTITDLGSSNGTRLNGDALEPEKPYPLHEGDRILVHSIELTFHEEKEP